MKNILRILFAALLFAVLTFQAMAALAEPVNGFGVGTTNGGGTASWVIVPARSANNGAPAVTMLSATSDLAGSKVQFSKVTATALVTGTNSTVTLQVNRTNGFASGTIIVIQHIVDNTYEKRTLTTMTTSTNLVCTAAPLGATTPGDIVYAMSSTGVGAVAVGSATVNLNGSYVYVGQKGKPILADLTGTSACTLQTLGGVYLP